jgi:hypothetical protein
MAIAAPVGATVKKKSKPKTNRRLGADPAPRTGQRQRKKTMTRTLWKPIVEESKLHETYKKMRAQRESMSARWMLDDVYQNFVDPDGNFLEQFQTTAFDARFFELYLHAYFSRSGFTVDRKHDRPDFIVTKGNLTGSSLNRMENGRCRVASGHGH